MKNKDLLRQLLQIEGLLNPIPIEDHIFDLASSQTPLSSKIKIGKSKSLFPQRREIFSGVGIIDLESKGLLLKEGIYENPNEKIIVLPFSLEQALGDIRVGPKYFYFHPKKFPYEFVSLVAKGDIRKLFFNCLRQIYHWQGIEYQHLWYYPNGFRSAFIFRLDTDFAQEKEIKKTYQLLKETGIQGTWFINTKEHQKFIPLFAGLKKEGEDIQLHCFVHTLFPDYQRNYDNILKGKEILQGGGIEVKGFAAPFGAFNLPLYQVLADLQFSFSSEFSLSYDDFPFYPVIKGKVLPLLQIPCHPIGVGRLLEAGFTPEEMLEYYKTYINWRYQNYLPIFIYDHPQRVAQFPELFHSIFNYLKEKGDIWLTTMEKFYRWWKEREIAQERKIIHRIKEGGEYLEDGENIKSLPKVSIYFPADLRRIKRIKFGLFPNLRLRVKGLLWKVNKYLKGKTK